jgi:hypothetical protein
MATHYAEQFKNTGDTSMEVDKEDGPELIEGLFKEKDVTEAVNMTNFQKALGEGWFDGSLL